MKKLIALILAVLMLMSVAGAEDASDLFAQIHGQLFEFSSGVGGWSTELIVGENGRFTGNYHDSEMGETGDGYPDGTLYGCTFHGQFSDPVAIDEYSWQVQISVELDEGQVPEAIEDNVRYVSAAPYGVEKASTVVFFRPGTPVDRLPEGFMVWSHLEEIDPEATVIPYYAIWNEADEAGFIVYPEAVEDETDWNLPETIEMTEAVTDVFNHAMEGLVGVNYEPLGYLGEKDGTYCILCRATVVYPGAKPYYTLVYVNNDGVRNIWEIWMDKHAEP